MSFSDSKKRILEKEYSFLNEMQRRAVFSTDGALLILAGAGSGKTTVLVNKIEFAIKYGNAYFGDIKNSTASDIDALLLDAYAANPTPEMRDTVTDIIRENSVYPSSVLAFTFTNKAAGELKDRLASRLGEAALDIWAGTFHSICVRILRRDIEKLGYDSTFTIYDTDAQKKLVKEIIKELKLEEKMFPVASMLSAISGAKDKMISADEYAKSCAYDYRGKRISEIYSMYEERLTKANALDFDDLILFVVRLLEENEECRQYWQNKFKYVYVDEFQDTNPLQYRLVRLLSGGTNNLTVVGDDDQSIYRFRGATIENILNFEGDYPSAKIVRLEQNYRSTGVILDAANVLIAHNSERKGKTLWTAKRGGEKITWCTTENEYDEARFVSEEIMCLCTQGHKYSDFAVLYRNNSQSNALEEAVRKSGIPYKIVKGMKFYDRKEIQDAVAYLTIMVNPRDNQRLKRIINEPKRGIGDATLDIVWQIAQVNDIPMYSVIQNADKYPQTERVASKLQAFSSLMDELKAQMDTMLPSKFVRLVLEKTGYKAYCEQQDNADHRDRAENLESFVAGIENYETEVDEPTMLGFLQEVSLVSELDSIDSDGEYVTLLTMHSAKGLEFPVVFVTGMEEGLFPSVRTIEEVGGLEEERRLAYVAITRAKKKLYLTNATSRRSYYGPDYHMASRFLKELPSNEILRVEKIRPTAVRGYYAGNVRPQYKPGGFTPKPSIVQNAAPKQTTNAMFAPGDKVVHKVFGEGTIISSREMAGDAMLEIIFNSGEKKKLMQNYAKLKKL